LNDVLYELKRPDMFATFAGLHISRTGEFTYVNAGHLPILHFQHLTKQIHKLDSTYPPLAVLPGQPFDGVKISVQSGDLLVLVTDGFVEVFDKNEQEFGQVRIENTILKHAGKPIKEIYDNLVTETLKFGSQSDDQTFLAIRVK
jgi:serine phosphatase RsbU (regulator of sigma subunit)